MGQGGSFRRSRIAVEHCISLPLSRILQQNRLVDPYAVLNVDWPDVFGRARLQVTIAMSPSGSGLVFDIIELRQRLTLHRTPLHFGGARWWFNCPGSNCGRRCASLYFDGGTNKFLCRLCLGLTYRSCQESHRKDPILDIIAAEMGKSAEQVNRVAKSIPKLHRRPWVRKRDRRPDYKSRWICPMFPLCGHD